MENPERLELEEWGMTETGKDKEIGENTKVESLKGRKQRGLWPDLGSSAVSPQFAGIHAGSGREGLLYQWAVSQF